VCDPEGICSKGVAIAAKEKACRVIVSSLEGTTYLRPPHVARRRKVRLRGGALCASATVVCRMGDRR